MSTSELYIKGARVWIPHPQKVWNGAKVTENYVKNQIKLETDDGEVKELIIRNDDELPPLRNPEILIGENDLTSLSYLHEPAVLHNLEIRFCRHNAFYTYCGIVLVAINPFKEMSIYGPDTIWAYRGQAMGDLDPHIFAVAEEAYTKMEREQTDQSIIISGESGAGKTVTAKYAMRYFATVGGSATETQVERKVLASSPIMEAIGNAKTIRNDNSSRFGKFIELQFSSKYRIVGASMRTYLLEKSRVVFQSTGERNYHIFYQMCATRKQLPQLSLGEAAEYKYLCDPDCVIPSVDDGKAYEETISAFSTLGFSNSEILDIFFILAAILHLGNIDFQPNSQEDGSCIQQNDQNLLTFCTLLGVDVHELKHCLCHRKIVSTRETFNKPMSVAEASGARDALAKHIYAQLFTWIVCLINKALNISPESKVKFIGVLDIYGFETFDLNSFEQFCINYANEKLQQQFNMHVFKLEQEDYLKENIEWKFIDFYDNQPCIDLIESKLGILDLLDEECRMPKGTDDSWAEKLYSKCSKKTHFVKPRFGNSSFLVKHFADKVEYDVSGFLEKNRDTIIEEQVSVFKSSSNRLVSRLFSDPEEKDNKLAVPKPRVRVSVQSKMPSPQVSKNKKTVGSQFRDSLNALMGTLNATTPHYIRCIKPNDEKAAFKYNPGRVVQQLRACGVLETIRISAAGFPSRWLYVDFFKRYRVLCRSGDINWNEMRSTCHTILNKIIKDNDKFKFGTTKIFFRAGQVAYLERLRSDRLLEVVIMIQKTVRGYLVRRRFAFTLVATNTLQRYVRGFLARRKTEQMRRNKAAIKIQAAIRGYLAFIKYKNLKTTVLGLQKLGRGYLARKKFSSMKRNNAAIIIQKHVRGWLARKKAANARRNVIIVQARIRGFVARRRFKKMKREARSAEHLKKLNIGLENKIISLQQRIQEMHKELKASIIENDELKFKIEGTKNLESDLKKVTKSLKEKTIECDQLKHLWEESSNSLQEKVKENEALKIKEKSFESINAQLKDEVNCLKDHLEQLKRDKQDDIVAQLKEEIRIVGEERDEERSRYQKLLAERDLLENKLEAIESKHHKRSPSDASTISMQDEDVGYGSVRSGSGRDETPTPEQQHITDDELDVNLILKLQHRLKYLDSENQRLHMELDSVKNTSQPQIKSVDPLMLQELEMENAKLRNDLTVLKECIASDAINGGTKKAIEQMTREWKESEKEVHRLRAENVELRRMFSEATMSAKSLAESSYSSMKDLDISTFNEDGELLLAFEAQKRTLRQLEDELQSKTSLWEEERNILTTELERLRGELEKERTSVATGTAPIFLQEQVTRLCSENLELQEKLDQQHTKARRLTMQVAELKRRLQEAGVSDGENNAFKSEKLSHQESLPMVRKKEREYMGMFEIKTGDVDVMLKHLLELKPKIAITLLPGLPAYILFMCVRYTDYINDEHMVQSILIGYYKSLKKSMKKKFNDVDFGVLWLSNTLKLIHNLKQYSGEKHFAKENTQTQNEQCLKNFDLSEIRQLLSDIAVSICQAVMRKMEKTIQPIAVAAILEHEAIPGLTSSGTRARSGSTASSQPTVKKAMDDLLSILTMFHRTLTVHGVDPELFSQFFRQLFYCLCANSLNNLLLRREYCHWSKGMHIRFNLSHLEQWARENKLQDPKVLDVLAPIIQASQLLQARKSDADVGPVADMCSALSINQIIKFLNLYTGDGMEERVSESFIKKTEEYLLANRQSTENPLMMDVNYTFPLEFPFNPSSIRLEDIEIPEILNLPMLRKL
ncbi:LOW QUALITY PROTEIN: unconventional myosin-Va [Halyomorpha halys]|uniref:LOW QUALITY PROTEIN: unconventional myosin-Va n=1 Tax=Halyomorpha halys TaxID=286706 RepID=UPI0034D37A68